MQWGSCILIAHSTIPSHESSGVARLEQARVQGLPKRPALFPTCLGPHSDGPACTAPARLATPQHESSVWKQTKAWFPALRFRSNIGSSSIFPFPFGQGNGATERQCGHDCVNGLRKRTRMNGNVMLETRHESCLQDGPKN